MDSAVNFPYTQLSPDVNDDSHQEEKDSTKKKEIPLKKKLTPTNIRKIQTRRNPKPCHATFSRDLVSLKSQ